ncbi:hypothetical protein ACN4EE_04280 [Geminocystis sp. CENA526]|uniref:hypothetical protein n=1 Tax=Geminocystis sp. CENA526 TaxID=1355871 RepID=UPI003D6F1DEE
MNFKNLPYFTALGVGLLFNAGINSAEASSLTKEETSNSHQQNLISQLEGHDTYNGGTQMEWGDYTLGRVIGKSGDILFIRTESGAVFHANGGFCPGSDVLVHEADGRYHLVDKAHSQWISRLKAKYGWKRVEVSGALNERTAAIWSELEASRTATPAVQPAPVREVAPAPTYTPQPEVQQFNQPVRGLW